MNKHLKHYNREQQIKYLELNTMIDVMLLKLTDIEAAEIDQYSLDTLK